MRVSLKLLILAWAAVGLGAAGQDAPAAWAGRGRHRLLVEVSPAETGRRQRDEMPAELVIDWQELLRQHGPEGKVNIASIQVIQRDVSTGLPAKSGAFAYARSPCDLPFRWYDGAIPYEFAELRGDICRAKGKIRRTRSTRAGYFYAALGDWERGHLAWLHTQQKGRPARYGIYFDLLPPGKRARDVPPRAWLGDGMPRCDRASTSSTGADHTRIAIDDWDGDGLLDIVFGESYGCLFWFPNLGNVKEPDFRYYRMLFDADGLPIDAGMGSAPLVVDWDGDGRKDVLVGTHWNRVLFFRNDGTNRDRRLTYRGFIEVGGRPLELPIEPVVGRPKGIFRRDYYPVLAAPDWNGDGRLDLLAGGYVTGRIYLFENVGQEATGRPRLAFRGPLEADGQPLNVGDWCAAPTVADFDADGDLDLISGCTPVTPSSRSRGVLLRYYENVGTARAPKLSQRPFPSKGRSRLRGITSPRAGDWNGDGLPDLAVAGRREICLYQNVGTKHEPLFDLSAAPLRPAWGSAPLAADQFLDWNRDGRLDVVRRYSVLLNDGVGNPYRFGKQTVNVLPEGEHIAHPSGHGDDWFWPRLCDFDEDGRFDVLFGDWWGRVWFHRNLTAGGRKAFDLAGQLLKLTSGRPLAVGPRDKDPTKDFTSRQGARTVFDVADFDRDGLNDLVVGDTFGIIRYYRNAGTRNRPAFVPPVVVGNQRIRLMVDATDWNSDGWPDVIAGAANGIVRVYLNTAGRKATRFEAGFDPGLPPIKQPRVIMADLNGDGDDDLYLPSTQGSVFLERSFLRHGYAKAKLLKAESRH